LLHVSIPLWVSDTSQLPTTKNKKQKHKQIRIRFIVPFLQPDKNHYYYMNNNISIENIEAVIKIYLFITDRQYFLLMFVYKI